jgi:hypothetical protein
MFIYDVFWGASFYESTQVVVFVASNALIFGLFLWYRHKTRARWISYEAEKWLESRSRHRNAPPTPWRKNIRHGMLWLPTIVASLVLSFFPETFGIASHLFRSRSLDHRHFDIPLTWVIAESRSSHIWVVVGRGIGRVGITPYWRKEEPVSEMTFSSFSYDPFDARPPKHAKVLSKRDVPFGNEILACWDIIPYADTRLMPTDPAFAEIFCYGSMNDFGASFSGLRTDSAVFYEILQRVTRRD